MRIKIIRVPALGEVDGIDLRQFHPGQTYEVGSTLGALMLAEEWAAPVKDDESVAAIPFSEDDTFTPRVLDRNSAPSLVKEVHPPSIDNRVGVAADLDRRRPRKKRDDV